MCDGGYKKYPRLVWFNWNSIEILNISADGDASRMNLFLA